MHAIKTQETDNQGFMTVGFIPATFKLLVPANDNVPSDPNDPPTSNVMLAASSTR
ncbi:hypothetical protein [Paramagnetospirillum caucaseum]|uniref:hypothetical protein n=1 Tax=Paramagnetospirillum caucaseum TaxID=1244869 RepID=UPI00034AAAF1|nr:hypothetical protein [Paramagnetospirillum caucaseum]